jgi:hypothetical protein
MRPLPGQATFGFVQPKPASGNGPAVLCPVCDRPAERRGHDEVWWCADCRVGFQSPAVAPSAPKTATTELADGCNRNDGNAIAPSDQRSAYPLAPKRGGLSS